MWLSAEISRKTTALSGVLMVSYPSFCSCDPNYLKIGKVASKTEVLAKAKSINVQIDNLCQFLPQVYHKLNDLLVIKQC